MNIDGALSLIRDVADFPQPGIRFYDITPLLGNPRAFEIVIQKMGDTKVQLDYVAGMEARGFIFASAISNHKNVGFIPIRKSGKLPFETFSESYGLEYGKDTLEIHQDACSVGNSVLIVDDVLATGGTACAAIKLIEKTGAKVAGLVFLLEIGFLNGRSRILDEFPAIDIRSLKII